jgi:hypothetical protein
VSDVRPHSFDPPRERPAPRTLRGHTLDGTTRTLQLTRPTLVVAVKPQCDGCRDFLFGDGHEFVDLDVVLVSATADEEWRDAPREVMIAPALMDELNIRSAPFYVLIDPTSQRLLVEGVLFAPAQVASEIASYLPR